MPRVWKPAADDQHIFDALPMPEGDVFLSDDELLMEMDGVATRAALNAALGPTARTRVTFDAEGRYWRKSYEIDKEPRCIYFLPAVQNARALEEYPDGVEPPFPRPEEKFQCKRKQPPRAPRKPSKTTARSGEKRPTSARPRMYTTPGEKVTRVDPVDDAELLVPDEDVVDLDEVAPVPRPVTRRDLMALEQRAEDALAACDRAEAARAAAVAAHAELRDRQDAVFARSATDSARLMLLSLDREANALSAERAARRRDVDRLRAKFSQEKELWKIDCERRAAARLDEERRRLEEGFRTNTRELQRQLDAQRTEVADLKKKQSQLNLELYGLRRLRGAWLGSRVAYLPEEPPPDSDFEGESLWPVVHAVGDFLSRICGGTLKRKQQKCLLPAPPGDFLSSRTLKTMDVEMTGTTLRASAMRARERAARCAREHVGQARDAVIPPSSRSRKQPSWSRVADGHKVSVTETSAGDGTYEAVGIATGAVLDASSESSMGLETGRSPADPRRIRGTQDGSNITKSDDFTMQGIHVNDSRAVDRSLGKPITDFQSPDRVHITTLAVGHESHALYEALDDVTDHFSTAATAQTDGVYQSEAEGRAVHVDYVCSGDMANLQTVSKKGFATGTSENARPCYCCAQTNRQMTTPKVVDDLCDVCRAAGRLVCYHAEMSTPAAVDEWRATAAAALTELRGELPPAYRYMREAKTLSAAQLRELAAEAGLDAGGTSAHLHARFAAYCGQHCLELENPNQNGFYAKFDCRTATPAQKTQFSLVVNDCLVDFGLAVTGNLGSRVEKLTQRLKLVDQYYELQAQLEHATPNSDALISLVEHMVPCVLHLENRTREKLLRLILNNLFVIYEKSVALAKLRPLEKFD
ncbi:unnamed protein product [Pelagomonas calceolata]|uniref:SAP domain-containing protein n=1 Tax=Pelagomonas calceolata TaxID=35677 RepID=A0A8J2S9K7_9STRA|nr:unnamed protein product [Pelagomonas calceolata]